jgi:hypothetical protein
MGSKQLQLVVLRGSLGIAFSGRVSNRRVAELPKLQIKLQHCKFSKIYVYNSDVNRLNIQIT